MSAALRQIATAQRMLNKFGEPVVITSPEQGGGYDPVTGTMLAADAGVTIEVKGYLGNYDKTEVDGANVLATDGKLLIPTTNPKVQVGWSAFVDNTSYRIVNVQVVRNEGRDIIQKLQVRL